MFIEHPIPPVFNRESEILILGSFPSVKSREVTFFYGHPQNRFWKVLSSLTNEPVPVSIDEKKALLLTHRIALWDVIGSCEITGSSDSSIRNVTPNPLDLILNHAPVRRIWLNGKTAEKYYRKYAEPRYALPAEVLPSTSPANAAWKLDKLIEAWSVIFH